MPKQKETSSFFIITLLIALLLLSVISCAPSKPLPVESSVESPVVSSTPVSDPYYFDLVLEKPDETVIGDLLIAQVCYSGGRGVTIDPPSADWIQILQTENKSDIGTVSFYKWVHEKASESDTYSFRLTSNNTGAESIQAAGKITNFSGIDSTYPINGNNDSIGNGKSLYVDNLDLKDPSIILTLFGISNNETPLSLSTDMAKMRLLYNESIDNGFVLCAVDQVWESGESEICTATTTQSGAWVSQIISLRLAAIDVTFNAGDHGTLTASRVPSVTIAARGSISPNDIPTVNTTGGYDFTGWVIDNSSKCLDASGVCLVDLHAGITFTAQYKRSTYTVLFEVGEHGSSVDQLVFSGVHIGDSISIPNVSAVSGWAFKGWDITPSTTVKGNAKYSAQYSQDIYTVDFLLGEHGSSADMLSFTGLHYGDSISIPNVSPDEGWTFDNWSSTPSTTVTGNATYTAQYTQSSFTVSFLLGDHGSSSDTLVFNGLSSGDTIIVPDVDAEAGWSFDGWDSAPETSVTASASYTAIYSQVSYTVTFNISPYGTSSDTLVFSNVHIGDTITIPSVTAMSGFRFLGWDISPSTTVSGNATYQALYEVYRPK